MDYPSKKHKEIFTESSKNLNLNFIKNNDDSSKNDLNLFKNIVKITRINSLHKDNIPNSKTSSLKNYTKITNFIDNIYNNEEHLTNKQICPINNLENITPNNKIMSSKMTCSIKLTTTLKGKSISKNQHKKVERFNHKYGDINHKHCHKYNNNYSFFLKLKEKNKIPSKTPYLDKKARKSAYNLKYSNLKDIENDIQSKADNKNINRISNKSFFKEIKLEKNNINNKVNEEEKNNSILKSEKKLVVNKFKDNINVDKKETKNLDLYNNTKQEKIFRQENGKEKKNSNNIIINVLSRPFFCCLNS